MPIYEYYCGECHGVFELLRPVREAARAQPCVECDTDSKRIVSQDFAVFTMRGGSPRRLPDRGTFWHLGNEVSKPIVGSSPPNEHPEVNRRPPPKAPTVEELEAFDAREERRELAHQKQREAMGSTVVNPSEEAQTREFMQRMRRRGTDRAEAVKRGIIRKRTNKKR
jgi:putative FmdB family regulatory protein